MLQVLTLSAAGASLASFCNGNEGAQCQGGEGKAPDVDEAAG
jgi:hypothetical protein